ncbi:MAG: thiamine-phosphate kinase [Rikenellaceae bacterium]
MGEFDFINGVKKLFESVKSIDFEGIGDDCAIFDMGEESLLFTTDMLQEDIHFIRKLSSPFDLGYKSLAVNLSDVAAMGGTPVASMLSLSLPKELGAEWAAEFMRGYHSLSEEFGVELIGGDTTSSKSVVTINVVAIGRVKSSLVKRRSSARVGDVILVNGSLGESGDGLASLLSGEDGVNIEQHMRPVPQIREGEWLATQRGVGAMMDISDGVASDIRHILTSSGVGAKIQLDKIPTSVDLTTALTAGEDYKLLFTARAESVAELSTQYQAHFAKPLYPIGVITQGDSLVWCDENGENQDVDFMGYRHDC